MPDLASTPTIEDFLKPPGEQIEDKEEDIFESVVQEELSEVQIGDMKIYIFFILHKVTG